MGTLRGGRWIGAALVFIVRELAVPLIFCIFAFGSPVRAAWSAVGRWRNGGSSAAVGPPPGPVIADGNGHPSAESPPSVSKQHDQPE